MSVYQSLLLGTGAIAMAAVVLPNTLGLQTYKRFKSKYRMDQTEEPVKEKHKKMFQEVMDDLKIPENERNKFQLFNAYGFDLFHAGMAHSRYGALVGIPMNFVYENVDDAKKDNIYLDNKPIVWSNQISKDFLNSLVLSENAQKFAMARETMIVRRNVGYILCQYLFHLAAASMIYFVLYKKLKLYSRKKLYTYLLMILCYSATIAVWFLTIDDINYSTDLQVDLILSKLGSNYIQGGKEFYEKLLSRNIALRTLLENGNKLFTVNGNETYFMTEKSAPISNRKNFFDLQLQATEQVV